jgi:ActR/RegA family two-component response regulator
MTAVLIVEDDVILGRALLRDLTTQGFAVGLARSVDEAVDALRTGPVDVLLTDLRLGQADGIDLLAVVGQLSPRTRSILMSAFATARDYQRAIELGAVRVLCKPFSSDELVQSIRQAVECESGFHGSVHGLSLIDMLQMFNMGHRSIAIQVGGERPGRILLREGQLVHADQDGLSGVPALTALLAIPAGSLATAVLPDEVIPTISGEFGSVLLDALRAVDENQEERSLEEVFDLEAPPPLTVRPDATPAPHLRLEAPPEEAIPEEAIPEPIDAETTAPIAVALEAEESEGRLSLLQRLRTIDGYVAACLIDDDGRPLAHDGAFDLRPAAGLMARMLEHSRRSIGGAAARDTIEDMLTTATTHYHLFRRVEGARAFVHLVLDRRHAGPAMARLALASTLRSSTL